MAWAGGNERERLDGNITVLKARKVDVAPAAALEQVALPQERVGVQVGDDQLFMQSFRSGGGAIRPAASGVCCCGIRRLRGLQTRR
ncbi:MAG: hypothetical protein ACM3SW_15425 [Actinomycetota bacterium]